MCVTPCKYSALLSYISEIISLSNANDCIFTIQIQHMFESFQRSFWPILALQSVFTVMSAVFQPQPCGGLKLLMSLLEGMETD